MDNVLQPSEFGGERVRLHNIADKLVNLAIVNMNEDAAGVCDLVFRLLAALRTEIHNFSHVNAEATPTLSQSLREALAFVETLILKVQNILGVTAETM